MGLMKNIKKVVAQIQVHHQQQNFQSSCTQAMVNRGPHNNTLYAGGGNDTVHAQYNKNGSVDVCVNGEQHHFTAEEARSLIIDLGSGNDTFTTSGQQPGANGPIIRGQAGNDSITGGAGNETIEGGAGNDYVLGGCGNDTINAGAGNDFVDGGHGNDTIEGGPGMDRLVGGCGWDSVTDSNQFWSKIQSAA